METKLIFAEVQRALRSIFHGAQSKFSTEDALIIHGRHGSSDFKRNLNGYFGVAQAQEILEEIFFKIGRGPEIICNSGRQQTKSLTKISTENALEYLAFGKNFNGDRLTARNLNENLKNN